MNNEEYNRYLLDLFKDCTFKAMKNSTPSTSAKFTNTLFEEASTIFNNQIANSLLVELAIDNPTISEKVKNYPSMFWKTNEGRNLYLDEYQKIEANYTTYIAHKIIEATPSLYEDKLSTTAATFQTRYMETADKTTYMLKEMSEKILEISNFIFKTNPELQWEMNDKALGIFYRIFKVIDEECMKKGVVLPENYLYESVAPAFNASNIMENPLLARIKTFKSQYRDPLLRHKM